MAERTPEGHPVIVLAIGGFLGGLIAGGNNAGIFGFAILALAGGFALMAATGHIRKEVWDAQLGTVLGLSTTIPLPAGFVGMMLGKALWGTP